MVAAALTGQIAGDVGTARRNAISRIKLHPQIQTPVKNAGAVHGALSAADVNHADSFGSFFQNILLSNTALSAQQSF